MFFSTDLHNQAVRRTEELLPRKTDVVAGPSRTHPWQVRPVWRRQAGLSAGGLWTAILEPGLVNGLPAAVRMKFSDAPAAARLRITAEQTSLSRPKIRDEELVDVFLDEQPQLPLSWRRIGTGASPTSVSGSGNAGLSLSFEPVPDFFKRLGVQAASSNPLGYEAASNQPVRYLAASDLVLNQPRVAVQSEVTVGQVVDGTITSVQPTFLIPADRQARVVSIPKFTPPAPPTLTPVDLLFAPFQEFPMDQLHLCTVYALSAYNPPSENIDGNWSLYFKYNLHWNVAHASRIAEAIRVQPLTLFTGLAGGIGDTLFNFILANNNDFTQAAANLITSNNQAGRFHAV